MMSADESDNARALHERSGLKKTDPKKGLIDGFSPDHYRKLVAKAGYPINRKRIIDIDLACKMRDAGWSCNQIGRLWGLSGATVKNRLKEAGRYY